GRRHRRAVAGRARDRSPADHHGRAGAAGTQQPRAAREPVLRRDVGRDNLLAARAAVLLEHGDDVALARAAAGRRELEHAAGHGAALVARLLLAAAGARHAQHVRRALALLDERDLLALVGRERVAEDPLVALAADAADQG